MNEPAPAPVPAARAAAPWLPLACAGLLALLLLAWLGAHFAPATMSPDANGYIVQARLLATQGTTALTTGSPAQFVGVHWLETRDGVFHSRYPAGLPVLFAAAWKLGGLTAALLVNPLLASATVCLVFLLARRFAGGWTALLAAAVYATNATVQQHALDADAHIAAAFFLTAGVLALLQFEDDPSPARGLLAGALLGLVPAVRYPEALAGVAVAAWLLWRIRPVWRVWPAVLGAALPVGALLLHNAAAYGAFWRTGYALTHEQTGFGWNYFAAHWLAYLHSLGGAGLGVFFAFGAAGLAGLAADAQHRSAGVLFAGIVGPLVLLYMAYYFGAGEGNLRFLVPLFPLLAAAGAWLLARVTGVLGSAGRAVWIAIAVLQLVPATAAAIQQATRTHASLRAGAQARAVLAKFAPAGSVVIVEHQLGESLDATGQWRLVEENLVGGGLGPRGGLVGPGQRRGAAGLAAPAGATAEPDQPSPQQLNKNRAQRARYDGVTRAERQARVWADLSAWAGGRPVYWFTRSLDAVENALPDEADYESLAEVDAPTMMGPGGGRGGGGGAMMGGPPPAGGFAPGGLRPPLPNQPGMNYQAVPGARGVPPGMAQNPKLRLVRIMFAQAAVAPASSR
jgi:4-amino-4-deoxy-L-arabinose transferase-like glycosyltransferase